MIDNATKRHRQDNPDQEGNTAEAEEEPDRNRRPLEGEGEALTRKAIELAKAGDMAALRLCLDRILPPRRSSGNGSADCPLPRQPPDSA